MQPSDTPRVLLKEFRVSLLGGRGAFRRQLPASGSGVRPHVAGGVHRVRLPCWRPWCFPSGIGCLLPLGAKALKLDPALTATPLITTIVDTCSLILLFEIASVMLKGVA